MPKNKSKTYQGKVFPASGVKQITSKGEGVRA